MKKIFYAFVAILFFNFQYSICIAQSWQWAKRGGDKAGTTSDEEVRSIAIDKNGNSYTLAYVYSDKLTGDIDVDGNKLGKGNNQTDLCLISFDCSGKYRWSKIIGGKNSDVACDVKTDTLGGVYIAGNFFAGSMYDSIAISTDTMLRSPSVAPYRFYQSLFIVKFDTSGNYRWLRMPEPDTMSVSKYSRAVSMEVDKAGNLSMMTCVNHSGAFAKGAYIVPTSTILPSMHILKYDANGNFIKGFPLSISEGVQTSLFRLRMAWDYKSDFYYVLSTNGGDPSVSDQPKFGATKMTGSNCLAKFSNTGANLWVKQSTTSGYTGAISSTPVVDGNGNVYIGITEYSGGSFLGYNAINKLSGTSVVSVFKISPLGTLIWGKNGSSSSSAKGLSIAVSPANDELAFTGVYLGKFYWGTDSMFASPSNALFIRLKSSDGNVIAVDSIVGGDNEWPSNICVDNRGNFYTGGWFSSSLEVNGLGTLLKYGGRNDFFIAKFGVADCKEPVSINENDLQKSIVKIYPNPTQDIITFEALQSGSEVRLFNIMGQQVHSFVAKNNKEQVSINHLASGMYLAQIRNVDGEVYTAKIVKE
jgi:hypothetical protein